MTGSRASERPRPLRRRRAALTIAAFTPAVLLLAGCSALPTGLQAAAVEPLPVVPVVPAKDPLLIKHGWDIPQPAYVKAHVAAMERMPFDGLTIALPNGLSSKVQSQKPVSYEQFKTALAPIASTRFTTLKHNFVMVYSSPAGDVQGDWNVPALNLMNLSRAAREAGLAGVFYDNEEYFGAAMRYPGNCKQGTVAECQAHAQTQGWLTMDALRAPWPDIDVMTTFGAWISDPGTPANLKGIPYNDIAWANQLSGSFVVGMVASAAGTPATVVDGGEIYTPRTRGQFATMKTWQKQGMAARSALLPSWLKPQWATTVSAGFGVYDRPWIGIGMDAAVWQTTLTNALATTDKYVWAYTERYDWWGGGHPASPVPAEWVTATRNALNSTPK